MTKQGTTRWRWAGARQAIPAVLASALFLGGCAATHVGDAWQCPVAQGAGCASVAEADPAAAASGKARALPITGPAEPRQPTEPAGARDAGGSGAACARGCDPLGWIGAWLGIVDEPGAGAGPAGRAPAAGDEGAADPSAAGLRTKERIARIWIAPFVDADGVYREGHWVRTVLEPSRWRLR